MSQHVKDLFSGMKLLNEIDEEVEAMSRLEDKEIIGLLFVSKDWQGGRLDERFTTKLLKSYYGYKRLEVKLFGIKKTVFFFK